MQETILSRLESSRKELLDLGLRNPLLNYKVSKARGVQIIREKSLYIYDILVKQGKAMTFLDLPEKEIHKEEGLFPVLVQPDQEESYKDTKLQTSEPDLKLQAKLLNTYYFARTSIEEQGVNILYLSLGMLHWFEAGNKDDIRSAPLVLIPVTLERSSAHERFRLKYNGSEIGANLSLQAKMLVDFNITIPDLPEADDFVVEEYLAEIKARVAHISDWKVENDAIELGFFSFGKFMIYHDLDSDKWPEESKPYEHVNLKALFDDGFTDAQPTATEEDNLDEETVANELFQVVDADSSQVLAMLAVHEGRNMVIQGPPGTGKSQTITNIIADAVGQGKKVLFVAEKMAALEVVKRRLDAINLGEACLELHSHKANKKELHEELKRVLELGKPTLTQLQQELKLLDSYRKELNEYCGAINHTIAGSNLSPQKVIGFLIAIDKDTHGVELPKIPLEQINLWDADRMGRAEAIAERIEARLNDIGVPSKLIFWGSQLLVMLPHEEQPVQQMLVKAKQAINEIEKVSNSVAVQFGLESPTTRHQAVKLAELCKLAAKSPDLKGINIKSDAWLLKQRDINELLETGKHLAQLYSDYKDIFITEAWMQNVLEIRQNLMAYGDKWYKFAVSAYKKSNQQLAAMVRSLLPDDVTAKIRYVDAISEAKRLESTLLELEPLALDLFGKRWLKQRSDWPALMATATYLNELHAAIADGIVPVEIVAYLSKAESVDAAKKSAELLETKIVEQETTFQAVLERIEIDITVRPFGLPLDELAFGIQLQTIETWIGHFPEIQKVIAWNNLAKVAADEHVSFLTTASVEWEGAKDNLKTALQKTWYEYLVEQAFLLNPALIKFERASHEEVVEKFKKLDLLNLHYNRARVALKHYENVPRQMAGGQVGVLRNEFNRRARFMPIRKLMQEAGSAIQAIKPVMMMSPMSIANFFAPGSIEFDLVIFDEASQVRPVEALGAIMRGKQLVVVGDSKQLPPTSFFDKMNTDIEDEDNVTADIQSILGMCDAQGAPQRMLKWHYRSRHESLISLSNHEFYENKLVIFPSPGSKQKMGLSFHHLPDAVYDRGKTRTNPMEAEAVANAVIAHALNNSKQSLGVVAFSTAQMQAIQNNLELLRRQHPETEGFFRSHAHEPFFVKNLENVQGDERDVIFISIGYGRVEDGKVPVSFGPLNNEGGERRLNVLITRAKQRCEVFTNITSADLKITETTKFGIKALKSFLYFAQFGRFEENEDLISTVKRPFEDQVADELTAKGYIVRKKVGSEGFYIDLCIIDPANPGRYIIGIECDGDAYASARSARDRDRLRKQVLENMGWQVFRIWSTDWFRNPKRELERLIAAIEKAKESIATNDAEAEEVIDEPIEVSREEVAPVVTTMPPYVFAKLPAEVAKQELHLHSFGKLAEWIEEVVRIEGPVHIDEMGRRMADAAGISKVGSRVKYTLNQATAYAQQNKHIIVKGDFLWPVDMEFPVIRDRSGLSSNSKKLHYIDPAEVDLAIQKVVGEAIAIQPEAAVPFIAKLFGFARVTEEMKKEILNAIELSVLKKSISRDGDLLKRSEDRV